MLPALALIMAVLLGACSLDSPDEMTRLAGETMGTTWSAVLHSPPEGVDTNSLKQRLQQRLDKLNGLMSTYDPHSELSRFNRHTGSDWFPISIETVEVAALAQELSRYTGGAFDVTVGPLVDLWGFGPSLRVNIPTGEQLNAALARVGYQKLEVRRQPPALRKRQPDLQVDLSAIAKGYAVDVLAAMLKEQGVTHFLLEIGGELQVVGEKAAGKPWRVAIEEPRQGAIEVSAVVPLPETALATSGNYRNYYEIAGQLFSHTIDPISGAPVKHRLAAVTVLDESCARADALATALMVMGEEQARMFAEANHVAAYFQVFSEDGLVATATTEFKRLTGGTAL